MTYQEKQEMKKLACKCLEKYFGFAPAMKQIVLLESASNGYTVDYLLFSIGFHGREFQLRRTFNWGKDTVEYKYCRYDVTMIEQQKGVEQLTYIIETLREAKCKAYDAWMDKKFELEKAQDDANEWLKNHPTAKMGDDMTISDIFGDTEVEYEKARDAYYMAEEIYRNFAEGEIEI